MANPLRGTISLPTSDSAQEQTAAITVALDHLGDVQSMTLSD